MVNEEGKHHPRPAFPDVGGSPGSGHARNDGSAERNAKQPSQAQGKGKQGAQARMGGTSKKAAVLLALCLSAASGATTNSTRRRLYFGGPVSLSGKYAALGTDFLRAWISVRDWVNEAHGGISVGGEVFEMAIAYEDDESSSARVGEIMTGLIYGNASYLVAGDGVEAAETMEASGEAVLDFALAPYGTPLD